MAVLALNQLEKVISGRILFEKVQLNLQRNRRYGLVGGNGSGKSTLLKIIAGKEEASGGDVSFSSGTQIGFLEQDLAPWLQDPIIEVAMSGQPEALAALKRMEAAAAGHLELDEDTYAKDQDVLARTDGYGLESKAAQILEGLGILALEHKNNLETLSGGYRLRVLLAQTLIGNPDVLLLDEPTNHLDLMAIHWLENFLLQYRGCLLLVSHEHTFINRVSTDTLDVDYETVTHYPGDYEFFLKRKAEDRETREKEIAKRQKEIETQQAFITRFKAQASKARQAQSRVKQVEKIKITPLPQTSRRAPHFSFSAGTTSGKDIVRLKGISKSFDGKNVLSNVSLNLQRGARLAIVGPNGVGKSTLINCLIEQLKPTAGAFAWGHNIQWGHYSQDPLAALRDSKLSILEWLWQKIADQSETVVRSILGQMLFSSDDVKKKVSRVSGGEAARLQFAWLNAQHPNVLLLDEPTNHLDMESIEALEKALIQYDGTIIFVSHHRRFLTTLATEVLELKWDGFFHYPGDYPSFTEVTERDYLSASKKRNTSKKVAAREEKAPALGPKKKRPNVQKLKKDQVSLMTEIDKTEHRLAEIHARYLESSFQQNPKPGEGQALAQEEAKLNRHLETIMAQWEEVSSLLEEFYPNQ